MNKYLLAVIAAVLIVGVSVRMASAECPQPQAAFGHPNVAHGITTPFVQAFVGCGVADGNSPNATTEGGVQSCKPPETFAEQAGSPLGSWAWDRRYPSYGWLQMKPISPTTCNTGTQAERQQCLALNPPGNTSDATIKIRFAFLRDAPANTPANGTGALGMILRATFKDRANGEMTLVDFPLAFPFDVVDGKAKARTSIDTILNGIGQPGLPKCSSVEVVAIDARDPNGNTFATAGLFLR